MIATRQASFFILLVICNFTCSADWKAELHEKIKNGTVPEWMQQQIAQDLQPFAGGISKETLENPKFNYPQCAKCTILNGKVTMHLLKDTPQPASQRATWLSKSLNLLSSLVSVPNVEFFIDLGDGKAQYNVNPIFCFCKKIDDRNAILIPDSPNLEFNSNIIELNKKHSWESKIKKAFWRGATTGGRYTLENCHTIPRFKLIKAGLNNPKLLDAKFSHLGRLCSEEFVQQFSNSHYIDRRVSIEDHFPYAYQICIDGNTATWTRLRWQLFSNSVVLKQESDWVQWYYNALLPWVHYIPFNHDVSDVIEKIKWTQNHDDEAQKIANNATQFAQANLRHSDLLYYIYVLLNEYAKLLQFTPGE